MSTPTTNNNGNAETAEMVDERLKNAIKDRDQTQVKMKEALLDLQRLNSRAPKRPRETMEELEAKIVELERTRTSTSIPLAEEKKILKQIHKTEELKRTLKAYETQEKLIKEQRVVCNELRDAFRLKGDEVAYLRVRLANLKTAEQIGCKVDHLMGMKLDCPKDKLGSIIGKNGKNVKSLMERTKVSVETDPDNKAFHLIGASIESLQTAAAELERVIATTEVTLHLTDQVSSYLTSKNIETMANLRTQHPHVYFDVSRKSTEMKLRGIPADIDKAKNAIVALQLRHKQIKVSPQELSLLIGKQGATVEKLVTTYQVAIEADWDKQEITVIGPADRIQAAMVEINDMMKANKEGEETIVVGSHIRNVLLLNGGAGIQQLYKSVNAAIKEEDANGHVNVNLTEDGVILKGKARHLPIAQSVVTKESKRLQSLVVKIKVDSLAVPVIIGKGGQGIKKLTDGKPVSIDMNRDEGEITVCGLEPTEIKEVVEAVRGVVAENQVERIPFGVHTDYGALFRDFIRLHSKEVNALVNFQSDDDNKQIIIRGTSENLPKAKEIIDGFLAKNYTDEMTDLTDEDINALLNGGKKSKIVELSSQYGVRLNIEREKLAVMAKGEKSKVDEALKGLRQFLHGGDGLTVIKIPIEDQILGAVIGKSGSTKIALEKQFPTVSIIVSRQENVFTLRGPETDCMDCRSAIMKIVSTARVTTKLDLDNNKQYQALMKSNVMKRLNRLIPVRVTIAEDSVIIKGMNVDVRDAVAITKEIITGTYEFALQLETPLFRRVKDTFRDESHIKRIEKASKAKVSLNVEKESVVFNGKRDSVKLAKREMLKIFDFLMEGCFEHISVPQSMAASIGKATTLADTAAETGTSMYLDRDLDSILIFSINTDKVKKAKEALKRKMEEGDKLVFVLKLEDSEDWLVSNIIGKNGSHVRTLRKDTNCSIDVNSNEKTITVSGEDEEVVAKAKVTLQEYIDKSRRECKFVALPESELRSFIGKSGGHITEFSKTYKVDIQVVKGRPDPLRITGTEEDVKAAQEAISKWISSREEAQREAQASETIVVRADQVPSIIGKEGGVIRMIQQEFGCKIDIERRSGVVTVRGGSAEKRKSTIEKIQAVLAAEEGDAEGAVEGEVPSDGVLAAEKKPAAAVAAAPPAAQAAANANSKPAARTMKNTPPVMEASQFPSLGGDLNGKKSASSAVGPSWASVVSLQPSQKALHKVEQEIQGIERRAAMEEPWEGTTPDVDDDDDGLADELQHLQALEKSENMLQSALNDVTHT